MTQSATGSAEGPHTRDLTEVVAGLVRELHPQRARFIDIQPTSRIERDLGIDSLGRTELILRIERAFRRAAARAQTLGEVETVSDLQRALELAAPAQKPELLQRVDGASAAFGARRARSRAP